MADSRMRVAVAGTNALALMIAAFIVHDTSHQIIVLSRVAQPQLVDEGYQVIVVDYERQDSLQHAVMGVDTIISTVTGPPQIELLQAAVNQGVRRFAPAEFEGAPANRLAEDSLDRGKRDVLAWLEFYQTRIESTVFVCGVLYERFAPGGLHSLRLGLGMDYGREGDYIVNPRNLLVSGPLRDFRGDNISLCLTAAQDVARLVVRSLDMTRWPAQQQFVGERMTVAQVIETVLRVRGRRLQPHPGSRYLSVQDLQSEVAVATVSNDQERMMRALEHVATVIGRYDFHGPGHGGPNMISFEQFLQHHWDQIPVDDD